VLKIYIIVLSHNLCMYNATFGCHVVEVFHVMNFFGGGIS
jgi:hypothetical protein